MAGGNPRWVVAKRVPRACGRALVKLYRYTLSPLIGFHCRHLPTCSDYADQSIERHGLWAGGWMTLDNVERDYILRVMESHRRDLGRTAEILGIHRKTLLRKLRQYGMA